MSDKISRESAGFQNALSLAKEHAKLHVHLVARRNELGLSQQQLADRMGYTLDWVTSFERNDYDPTQREIRRYALALGVVIKHEVVAVRNPLDEQQYQQDR